MGWDWQLWLEVWTSVMAASVALGILRKVFTRLP